MQALICSEYGPPEKLAIGEFPDPAPPGPGQVLIQVTHAGVSFVDTLMVRDLHQNKHPVPFVPGMEVAGTIKDVGPDVDHLVIGQRVAALVYDGGFAPLVLATATECFVLPEAVAPATAAAVLSVGLTAQIALQHQARLQPAEIVLISGATGGVGMMAVQIAKAMQGRVIAVVGGPKKVEFALALGADHCLDASQDDIGERLKQLTDNQGVDVVLDQVAGDFANTASAALGWGGRFVIIGFAGGKPASFAANRLLVKNRAALGMALMYYRTRRTDILQQAAQDLFASLGDGRIKPIVSEVQPLSETPALIRRIMDRKSVGKAVVRLAD